MRAVLVGLGAVGARSARQLLSSTAIDQLVVLARRPALAGPQVAALGGAGMVQLEELNPGSFAAAVDGAAAVLLTGAGPATGWARLSLKAGVPTVSTSDDTAEVRSLLDLDELAHRASVPLVVGACMAPGLSCLLAWWVASRMDEVSEFHIATLGTGGPVCARRRHHALGEPVEEWREGSWARKVASSGRELVWFPGQAEADCYRVNRPDALLLTRAFTGLRSVTTRAAASRRDRFTSWLPMMRRPHPEGTVGAVRVEARGMRAGAAESLIVGASGRPALLAGTVAAVSALAAASGQLRPGAGGLASLARGPGELLADLSERGVRMQAFEGADITPAW